MASWGDFLVSQIEAFQVQPNSVTVWFLGGTGLVVKTPQATVYVDPYFGGSHGATLRMIPVPIDPKFIKLVDAVVFTHEHLDHCHVDSVRPIYENTKSPFVGAKAVVDQVAGWGFNRDRLSELNAGSSLDIKDVRVYAVESYDPLAKGAIMLLLEAAGVNIFHSGDAWYFPGFAKVGEKWRVDLAFIGVANNPPGRHTYMTPCDFLRAARDLKARKAIPTHWDIWKPTYMDPSVVQRVAEVLMPDLDIVVLRVGDRLTYP